MPAALSKPMRGVFPPMITPLRGRDELDGAGVDHLIEHLLAGGVNGLFVLGTTGEAPALSYRVRRELVRRTVERVDGRVPVLAGITDTALGESIELACAAAAAGARAVVAAAPYYFAASQSELLSYVEELARETPLPLFLYNAPAYTHHAFAAETVLQMSEIPNVAGIKDSSLDMLYFHKLVRLFRDRPEFTLLVGPEELMAEAVLLGGHGGMCGGANIHPQLYVELYRAAAAGELERVNRLQARVIDISARVYHVTGEESAYLRGLKCAVSLMGICGDIMAPPFRALGPEEREQVRRHLIATGLLET
jgi:4-hydroxy-tetrahydrodipicolinate synthase